MENARLRRVLGHRLRAVRIEAGLSQLELAARVGLQRATLGNIEAGRQGVVVDRLVELAEALQVSPRSLLQGLTPEARAPYPEGLSEAQKDWLDRLRRGAE